MIGISIKLNKSNIFHKKLDCEKCFYHGVLYFHRTPSIIFENRIFPLELNQYYKRCNGIEKVFETPYWSKWSIRPRNVHELSASCPRNVLDVSKSADIWRTFGGQVRTGADDSGSWVWWTFGGRVDIWRTLVSLLDLNHLTSSLLVGELESGTFLNVQLWLQFLDVKGLRWSSYGSPICIHCRRSWGSVGILVCASFPLNVSIRVISDPCCCVTSFESVFVFSFLRRRWRRIFCWHSWCGMSRCADGLFLFCLSHWISIRACMAWTLFEVGLFPLLLSGYFCWVFSWGAVLVFRKMPTDSISSTRDDVNLVYWRLIYYSISDVNDLVW